ncbi:hypothetical protein H6G04_10040 [Calothrix membranacea FACHB-236]|nr:hypothetical protein [Calothrix membranacea FACHB-236]
MQFFSRNWLRENNSINFCSYTDTILIDNLSCRICHNGLSA